MREKEREREREGGREGERGIVQLNFVLTLFTYQGEVDR